MSSISFDIFARDHASETFDKLGRKVDSTSSFFERHKGVVMGAMASAGAAVVAFGKQSIDAYLDADKSQRVLEDAYKRFPAVADVPIQSMRDLSKALEQKTKFDDDDTVAMMGKLAAYKLTGQQIMELTPLVQDYAQKTGKDILTAGDDMGKALLGQGRALKLVGIDFKNTGTTAGNFDELVGGLRTQVGGFAEQEGKSAEGRLEILKNKFGDLQESVGEKLLPVMEKATDFLLIMVDAIGSVGSAIGTIPTPVLAAVAALTAFHLLSGPLGRMRASVGGVMQSIGEAFGYAGQSAERAGGGFKGFAAGVRTFTGGGVMSGLRSGLGGIVGLLGGPWGIALAGATMAVAGFAQAQANAKADADGLRETIDKQTGAWTDLSKVKVGENLAFNVSKEDLDSLAQAGINIQELASVTLAGGPAFDAMIQKLTMVGVSSSALAGPAEGLRNAMNQQRTAAQSATDQWSAADVVVGGMGDAMAAAGSQAGAAQDPVTGLGDAADSASGDMQAAADAAKKLAQATLDVSGAAMDADRAQLAFKDALATARQAIKDNGHTLNINSEAGRKNRGVLLDVAEAANTQAKATYKTTGSVDAAAAAMRKGRTDFVNLAMQMNGGNRKAAELLADKYGLTRGSVKALSQSMDDVPRKIVSGITVNTAQARTATQNVKAWLAGIHNKTVYATVIANIVHGANVRAALADLGRYKGGPVRAGQVYPVGENPDGSFNRTTELFMPDRDGTIINAAETQQMLRSGGFSDSGSTNPGASRGEETFVGVVQFVLGGKVIQEELLRLKRTNGGMSLGLA